MVRVYAANLESLQIGLVLSFGREDEVLYRSEHRNQLLVLDMSRDSLTPSVRRVSWDHSHEPRERQGYF